MARDVSLWCVPVAGGEPRQVCRLSISMNSLAWTGEKDARVPLTQAIGFHRALRQYGVPTELVVYPREDHPIRERMHQLDLLRRVRSWYDRWLRS